MSAMTVRRHGQRSTPIRADWSSTATPSRNPRRIS